MSSNPRSTTTDPFEAWRQWLSESERQWNSFLNEAMASPEFSASMARFMELGIRAQKEAADLMGRVLENLNLPSRSDVLALGDRISALDERLRVMQEGLAAPVEGGAAAAQAERPARTRRPPSRGQ
jgi:hypothetical protein